MEYLQAVLTGIELLKNIWSCNIGKFLNYKRILDENMETLTTRMEELRSREEDINTDLINAQRLGGKKRKREVETWLKNVKHKKNEVDQLIEQEVGQRRYFSRFRFLRLVEKNTQEVSELIEKGRFSEGLLIDKHEDQVVLMATPLVGQSIEERNLSKIRACPCGLGACLVLTAKTEKNRGRKFYKCPHREENGGCGFFEWCDNSSGTNNMTGGSQNYASKSKSSTPDVPCPSGAGSSVILTAKTGKNIGQQYYRCPANQGSSCGYFKWCNDHTLAAGLQGPAANASKVSNIYDTSNKSYGMRSGSSCFKCGKEGHWAKDCSMPSSDSTADVGGRFASSGTCYKCGKPGHWAKDCSF